MTIKEILSIGISELKEKDIEDSSLKARILLSHIIKCKKEELIIKLEKEINEKKQKEFIAGIEKISRGYPLEYVTNSKEFMKMEIYVDENVLIPRQDTEILVEEVIRICKKNESKDILELCTGSGIIAISLKKYMENAKITATDISYEALNVAKQNVANLLNQKIEFIQSDMFENIKGKFDIIVSNPPYIKSEIIKQYSLEYEPKLALDGGTNGLKFYNIIINEGYKYLNPNGIIALEIGYDQKEEIMEIVEISKKYKEIYCIKDLGGNNRVIVIKV